MPNRKPGQPSSSATPVPQVRKGQPDVKLSQEEFRRRLGERFYDPVFDPLRDEIERLEVAAWNAYDDSRKSPRTRPAGQGFAEPDFPLPVEWLEARQRILEAEHRWRDAAAPRRVLVIAASPRSDQTCPGEMSKTYRLACMAVETLEKAAVEVELLDLSRLTSEYGRQILPCKACVSTAMPLCHWPCSCYPNHALGQVNDWMNELYPKFVGAHGIMILSPVHWYQVPSVLKLLMDRLVCADGGNPDPTTTHVKDPERAKRLEMEGWDYPRHLAGRRFAVVAHGDSEGADIVRRAIADWFTDMHLVDAGRLSAVDRYVGYMEPYATSHDDLDADTDLHQEVKNAAASLAAAIHSDRSGAALDPGDGLTEPRPK